MVDYNGINIGLNDIELVTYQNEETQVLQANFSAIDDVIETSWCRDNQMTTTVKFTHLLASIVAAV